MTFSQAGIGFAVGFIYLVSHFLLYVGKLRQLSQFKTELYIFLYHFVSALLFSMVTVVSCMTIPNGVTTATALGLVAMHGIYSTSFLELWSLAQGGYSIAIVTGLESGAGLTRADIITEFARIGDAKKSNRLSALMNSSLIQRSGDSWELTGRGRLLALLLTSLLWLANIKKSG